MKRALLISFSALMLSACAEISLEGDAARPWACIPTQGDGGGVDAGKQCSDGWACGFDQKCFLRDGGQAADAWRCVQNEQCPLDWKCGVDVSGERFCLQLDAGAASACNVATDCEGGWRCGLDEKKCFNPVVTDVDAGRSRRCGDDTQCANGFRCGQVVGGSAFCLQLDAGSDAPCVDDDGCEGGWRCDLHASRCVSVRDVVDPGASQLFGGTLVSPKSQLPAPLLTSVTKVVPLPWELLDLEPRPNSGIHGGVIFAGLHDGGVWVHAQSLERNRFPDGGRQDTVRSRFFRVDSGVPVVELVAAETGVLVRYADFTVKRFVWDGGIETVGNADGIRGIDLGDRIYERRLLLLQQGVVRVLDQDGGAPLPPLPDQPDGSFSVPVEVFVTGLDDITARVYTWTRDGTVFAWPLEDGGRTGWEPRARGRNISRTLSASGAWLDMERPAAILEVAGPDGGSHLAPYLPAGIQDFMHGDETQTFPACPSGATLLQSSLARVSGNAGAGVRCRSTDGGVIAAFSRFSFTGLPPGPMNPAFVQSFEQLTDDLEPYLGPVTNARGASTVRAHASSNARYWFTLEADAGAPPGQVGLRPLVLDRAPASIVQVPTLGLGLVSSASGLQYDLDDELGFTAGFNTGAFIVLDSFRNEPNWIITNTGAIDLSLVSAGGQPRSFMVLRPGQTLQSPVSAYAADLTLNGSPRRVVLLTSGDALWASDVTEAVTNPFGPQATLEPVFVPMPGVRLRSLTLVPTDGGVGGFLTTNISTIEFSTDDLVQFKTSTVAAPQSAALPLEVWTEANRGRVGARDGTVWSLPIMVPLTGALTSSTGGTLNVDDYARRCDVVFATTREGVFALQPADGGLPRWNAVSAVNSQLESFNSLRLYETSSQGDRLFVSTPRGQIVEVTGTNCP